MAPTPTADSPAVIRFFAAAYAISWLFWIPLMLGARDWIDAELPLAVLFNLGGIGPAAAALVLTYRRSGGRGVRDLLGRVVRWRTSPSVYATAVVLPASVVYLSLGLLFAITDAGGFEMLPLTAIIGGFFGRILLLQVEEIGWRGYAQPALQERTTPLKAALIVGAFWGPWHLPVLIAKDENVLQGALFMLAIVTLAVLIAWLFNASKESLLVAGIAHSSYNTAILSFFPSLEKLAQLVYSGIALGVGVVVVILVIVGTRARLSAPTSAT